MFSSTSPHPSIAKSYRTAPSRPSFLVDRAQPSIQGGTGESGEIDARRESIVARREPGRGRLRPLVAG